MTSEQEGEFVVGMVKFAVRLLGNLGIYLIIAWIFVWLFNVHVLVGLGAGALFLAFIGTRFAQAYSKGLTRS
jgi:hypothetical protein